VKVRLKKTGSWLLMWLFISYYVSSTSFIHTHHFAWGTVTHSHPYNPFGDAPVNHNHTQGQCITIAFLTHLVLIGSTAAAVVLATVLLREIELPVRRYRSCLHIRFAPLRAPPLSSC